MDVPLGNTGLIQVETNPREAGGDDVAQVQSSSVRVSGAPSQVSQSSGEPPAWEKNRGLRTFVEGGLI
jgi:hypothetical protein